MKKIINIGLLLFLSASSMYASDELLHALENIKCLSTIYAMDNFPIIDDYVFDDGFLYILSGSTILSYSIADEEIIWKNDFGKSLLHGKLTRNSKYLIINRDSNLLIYDSDTGKDIFSLQSDSEITSLTISKNSIYLIQSQDSIRKLDLLSGKEIWKSSFPDIYLYNLYSDDEVVIAVDGFGNFNSINETTGYFEWHTDFEDTDELPSSDVLFTEDYFCFNNFDGYSFICDKKSGKELSRKAFVTLQEIEKLRSYPSRNYGSGFTPVITDAGILFINKDYENSYKAVLTEDCKNEFAKTEFALGELIGFQLRNYELVTVKTEGFNSRLGFYNLQDPKANISYPITSEENVRDIFLHQNKLYFLSQKGYIYATIYVFPDTSRKEKSNQTNTENKNEIVTTFTYLSIIILFLPFFLLTFIRNKKRPYYFETSIIRKLGIYLIALNYCLHLVMSGVLLYLFSLYKKPCFIVISFLFFLSIFILFLRILTDFTSREKHADCSKNYSKKCALVKTVYDEILASFPLKKKTYLIETKKDETRGFHAMETLFRNYIFYAESDYLKILEISKNDKEKTKRLLRIVISHEISHIKRKDTLFGRMSLAFLVGVSVFLILTVYSLLVAPTDPYIAPILKTQIFSEGFLFIVLLLIKVYVKTDSESFADTFIRTDLPEYNFAETFYSVEDEWKAYCKYFTTKKPNKEDETKEHKEKEKRRFLLLRIVLFKIKRKFKRHRYKYITKDDLIPRETTLPSFFPLLLVVLCLAALLSYLNNLRVFELFLQAAQKNINVNGYYSVFTAIDFGKIVLLLNVPSDIATWIIKICLSIILFLFFFFYYDNRKFKIIDFIEWAKLCLNLFILDYIFRFTLSIVQPRSISPDWKTISWKYMHFTNGNSILLISSIMIIIFLTIGTLRKEKNGSAIDKRLYSCESCKIEYSLDEIYLNDGKHICLNCLNNLIKEGKNES